MTQDATSITEQHTSTIVKENMSLDALDSTEQDMVQDASCSTATDFKFKEDAEAQDVRVIQWLSENVIGISPSVEVQTCQSVGTCIGLLQLAKPYTKYVKTLFKLGS